ncbi:hypothetical protein RRG08_038003 [Elysia crispata]|uniref:Fibrinogen C-terminal domain-containing protein n=1 Tax=Elysia crispata TaxID=231223 RepID=A0AAE1ADH1_9GAST|nr:hypothetical protein RRG08_038003 [Elysia crispata]
MLGPPNKLQDDALCFVIHIRARSVRDRALIVQGRATHFKPRFEYLKRRLTGKEDFYRRFADYVFGFGDIESDHWLGLHFIHVLTYPRKAELVIRVRDNGKYYDLFVSGFIVKGGRHFYQMTFDKIERGSLSHEAFERSKSSKFTTRDVDRDSHVVTTSILYIVLQVD